MATVSGGFEDLSGAKASSCPWCRDYLALVQPKLPPLAFLPALFYFSVHALGYLPQAPIFRTQPSGGNEIICSICTYSCPYDKGCQIMPTKHSPVKFYF